MNFDFEDENDQGGKDNKYRENWYLKKIPQMGIKVFP